MKNITISILFVITTLSHTYGSQPHDTQAQAETANVDAAESVRDSERQHSFAIRLLAASTIQLFSGAAHYTHVPAGGAVANIPEQFNSFIAFIATYGLFTPYDFFDGASCEFPKLTQEFSAFLLALVGNYYVNPTALSPEYATFLWLTYLVLGTIKNSELWNASTEDLEEFQRMMRKKSQELMSLAVALTSMLAIKQWDNYREAVRQ